jgi:hypothetical protein
MNPEDAIRAAHPVTSSKPKRRKPLSQLDISPP